MSIFFTADTHFGHDSIRHHCFRPFDSTHEMNVAMTRNWNSIVSGKDEVYILGDFAWKNHTRYLQALNGHKILIIGSHDHMKQLSLKDFSDVVGSNHRPGILEKKIDDQYVVMSHYAMESWPRSHYNSWHLHGHSHGRLRSNPHYLRLDVGVDNWSFYPVAWETVSALMQKQEELRKETEWLS